MTVSRISRKARLRGCMLARLLGVLGVIAVIAVIARQGSLIVGPFREGEAPAEP
jgi:hypothetical protein